MINLVRSAERKAFEARQQKSRANKVDLCTQLKELVVKAEGLYEEGEAIRGKVTMHGGAFFFVLSSLRSLYGSASKIMESYCDLVDHINSMS